MIPHLQILIDAVVNIQNQEQVFKIVYLYIETYV